MCLYIFMYLIRSHISVAKNGPRRGKGQDRGKPPARSARSGQDANKPPCLWQLSC